MTEPSVRPGIAAGVNMRDHGERLGDAKLHEAPPQAAGQLEDEPRERGVDGGDDARLGDVGRAAHEDPSR